MTVEKVLSELEQKKYQPVYWLEGEESFFIDQIIHFAEHKILNESEASFNLSIFYGKDSNWADVLNACKRYPMFGDKQVVIVKEAQQLKDIDKFENYIQSPLQSTIVFFAYKEKKVDARTKLAKILKAKSVLISTKKLYDNELPSWTENMIKSQGLAINNKALQILVEHVGNDLSRLYNEVEKLKINLKNTTKISEDDIEQYIGISKEFNVFELQDALSKKDMAKCLKICQYFASNPKAAPIQLVLPTLYGYFSKVYCIFSMPDQSINGVKPLFFYRSDTAEAAVQATKLFGYNGIEKILILLHEYNLKSIGINSTNMGDGELLKEMIIKIMQ